MSEIKILITENITPEIRQFFPYLPAVYVNDVVFKDQKMILRSLGIMDNLSNYPKFSVYLLHSSAVIFSGIQFDYRVTYFSDNTLKDYYNNKLVIKNDCLMIQIGLGVLPFGRALDRLRANFIRKCEQKDVLTFDNHTGQNVKLNDENQDYKSKNDSLSTAEKLQVNPTAKLAAKLELRDKLRVQYNEMCSKVDQEIEELTQLIKQFS